ncbi:MAG: class I SAM-dependent methyltransferase [Pseudonocardiaceae bacterium]
MKEMLAARARRLLAHSSDPRSLASCARHRRGAELTRRFPSLPEMRGLDLGGTPAFWRAVPHRPAAVTTVNLEPSDADELWIDHVVGDACEFHVVGSPRYDLVVSNSLLEHVGGHEQRRRLAEAVHDSAPAHWVQTPYRYFPIEPRWLAPGWQFLPPAAQATILCHWPFWLPRTGPVTARAHCGSCSPRSWSDVRR